MANSLVFVDSDAVAVEGRKKYKADPVALKVLHLNRVSNPFPIRTPSRSSQGTSVEKPRLYGRSRIEICMRGAEKWERKFGQL